MKSKSILTGLIVWGLLIVSASAWANGQVREKQNFNKGWRFSLSDSTVYSSPDYNDKRWRTLDLPHDWSVEFDFSEKNTGRNAFLPGGTGWYRKSFLMPDTDKGKQVEIQFDGIYKNASIWLNGKSVGIQHDGYTSFYFDITELLHYGEMNTLAVRVDNSYQPSCRWYSGSGIYRNVWLRMVNPTHIATWGTFISTPEINEEVAKVHIETTVENMNGQQSLSLQTIIFNEQGENVGEVETSFEVGNLRTQELRQDISVRKPELWSVDTPHLYTTKSVIRSGNQVVDEYTSTFGIRDIAFDAEKGFFLNGENLKMKGVCLHHDAGVLGAAVPVEVWERRLKKLKEIGCNAIRTSHNPTAPEFLDLCDQLGFLVMDEFVDKWNNETNGTEFFNFPMADPYFPIEWKKNFGETIRRDRNHPSVIIWSVGNENNPPGDNAENNGMRILGAFVRSMDPTRPVISGMERGKDKPVAEKVADIIETCNYMDLIALNYGEQWCKLIADQKPGKPYVSTESYTYFNSELEKRFANIEKSPWIDVLENDNNMGLFLWVGIDYLGESKRFPALGSSSGLLDMAGFRKNISFLYEAFWSKKPMVHIEVYDGDADDFSTSGRWGWPPMKASWNLPKDSVVDLVTYTNCETVDLYLNDKKIGTQQLADFPNWIMKWRKIKHQPGTLRAVGKIGGKEVCSTELKTAGAPHHLVCYADSQTLKPGEVVHVEITLVDKAGVVVPNDDRRLKFKLEGDGEILGLSNGDIRCHEPFYQKSEWKTYQGKCLAIIKAGNNLNPKLKLTITGEGIREANVEFQMNFGN